MNKIAKQIVDQATLLSPDDLAEVVEALHARLHAVSKTWEDAWAAEAKRRSQELDHGRVEVVEADLAIDEARADLLRRRPDRRAKR